MTGFIPMAAESGVRTVTNESEAGLARYIGNGVTTFYSYGFDLVESSVVTVEINGAISYIPYTIQDTGIVFDYPPLVAEIIEIKRFTDVEQLAEFFPFDRFGSDKLETALDYMIILKQEVPHRGSFNLTLQRGVGFIALDPQRTPPALVSVWATGVDDDRAGMFSGEVTKSAPADGATDPKQQAGHMYLQWDDTVAPPYEPESSFINEVTGWAATQDGLYAGANKAHPFDGQTFSNFTMSCLAKVTSAPVTNEDRALFNLNMGGGVSLSIRQRQEVQDRQIFWRSILTSQTGGEIMRGTIEHDLELIYNGWSTAGHLDWSWIGLSYSQSLARAVMAIVNIERGLVFAQNIPLTNAVDLEFTTGVPADSPAAWASNAVTSLAAQGQWRGYQSQVYMHSKFFDLLLEAERNRFVRPDGALNIQTGSEVDGTQPLVYLENGHPSSNTGSANVGTHPADFYLDAGTTAFNHARPPLSANP
jgi:hypothetical protein